MNEFDAYSLLQSLGNYLKTDIEISSQNEKSNVKITVSNIAPTEPIWPLVVFTGVGLAFNEKRYGNSIRMKRSTNYKVDLSNAPQGGGWNLLKDKQFSKVEAGSYPLATSDEQKHGFHLWPGQSIVFKMSIKPDDLKDIWVEGTLSRRHLFHHVKELMPSSG